MTSRPGPVERATPLGRPGRVDPAVLKVTDVLLSGNHAEIRRWRKRAALSRTLARRPELLSEAALDEEEQEILRELVAERDKGVGYERDLVGGNTATDGSTGHEIGRHGARPRQGARRR